MAYSDGLWRQPCSVSTNSAALMDDGMSSFCLEAVFPSATPHLCLDRRAVVTLSGRHVMIPPEILLTMLLLPQRLSLKQKLSLA